MKKVTLRGYILVPESDLEAVTTALEEHKRLTLAEPGCLVFEVSPDDEDSTRFNVYEEFVDEAAFDAHQARIKESEWARVTRNVERHYERS